ncbi:MAG: TetR/AcrR family transcriptional regulator C-terminal domain-containing protein [Actinomycetota bacterium]|nr:TetR/AcrR family transcriptional regulator C-terminal domain-containing protein [Actinomycetota bacterium]
MTPAKAPRSSSTAPEPGNSRRALTRQTVIETAIEYVDKHGLAALTMRALGQELGVEAMSLYHHVNGREDLLEGIVATLVDGLRVNPEETLGPVDGWQTYVQHLAVAVRQLANQHPHIFPLVATRHPAAPWLRPPLRSLELVEDFLEAMSSRGLDDKHAVHVYKCFTSFLLGHLLLEVSAASSAPTSPDEAPLDEGDADVPNADQDLSLDQFPTVLRLRELLAKTEPTAEFESALEALLDRLDLELSQ